MCELISTLKKKKKKEKVQAGNELWNILPKFSHAREKPPPLSISTIMSARTAAILPIVITCASLLKCSQLQSNYPCTLCTGGFNGTRRLSSIERYDPDTEEWRPLPPMLNARSNFAMTVSNV